MHPVDAPVCNSRSREGLCVLSFILQQPYSRATLRSEVYHRPLCRNLLVYCSKQDNGGDGELPNLLAGVCGFDRDCRNDCINQTDFDL